ncbi:hypothetical protein HDV04_003331 [Boothiomyces sp. JEL0838]|nr:hypothetical protein HDV04_003331 [Boothiomyces sp. JEL0838]
MRVKGYLATLRLLEFDNLGKTTIILDLLKKCPKDYKIVVLKNEFGDVKVDSELMNSHVQVTEMMNGCLCCVLVGQMKNAILEIQEKQKPDRIIIETSGSAFPAPIAWQIRELKDESIRLDSIITVIDCVNFKGYADTSYTAKMQAQYTDLIMMNKHDLVSERELDIVLDYVNELNTDTPKIKWDQNCAFDICFGLDTPLFQSMEGVLELDKLHHEREIDIITILQDSFDLKIAVVEELLQKLPKDEVYRVKGIFPNSEESLILNWAFGRWTWSDNKAKTTLKISVMGIDLKRHVAEFENVFPGAEISFSPAHRH